MQPLDSVMTMGLSDAPDWRHLVLPAGVIAQLKRAWCAVRDASCQRPPDVRGFNVLVFGPPGTGKTEITREFAGIDGVRFISVVGPDLRRGWVGQSAARVREVFAKARESAPAVLRIDLEMGPYSDYCVFPRRGSTGHDHVAQEILLEALVQMDQLSASHCPVFILGETFQRDEVDRSILSRFEVQIELPNPDEADRREILRSKISIHVTSPAFDVEEVCSLLAHRLERRTGRDLESLVRQACLAAGRRGSGSGAPDTIVVTREDMLAQVDDPN